MTTGVARPGTYRERPTAASLGDLTPRQRTIALLVADGLTNQEIEARLAGRLKTVKNHLTEIYRRTGLPTRTALAVWAARQGWADDRTVT